MLKSGFGFVLMRKEFTGAVGWPDKGAEPFLLSLIFLFLFLSRKKENNKVEQLKIKSSFYDRILVFNLFHLQFLPGCGTVLLSFKDKFITAEDNDLGGGVNFASFH